MQKNKISTYITRYEPVADGKLNDISSRVISSEDAFSAIATRDSASVDVFKDDELV